MEIPTVFIEIGSTETQWNDPAPARIIAAALREVVGAHRTEESYGDDQRVLVGVGGGHYAPRFTDVALSRLTAFGHMIPTYQIDAGTIDDEMLSQALAKTPKASGVYFHRKELKKSTVTTLSRWFEDRGIPTVSSSALPALGEMAGR
jgi:D-aminoacyl-tRNA deacylase